RRPPLATPLFPYTTLFRSAFERAALDDPLPAGMAHPPTQSGVIEQTFERAAQSLDVAGLDQEAGDAVLDELRNTADPARDDRPRSEEHTSELQSPYDLVCR